MLSTVRARCSEIFKYTGALQSTGEEDDNQDHDDEDYDDVEHSSEFVLLEMVVEKLATIVQLTTASRNEDVEEMTEHDQHAHNWLQGAGVKASRIAKFTRAKSKLKLDPSAGPKTDSIGIDDEIFNSWDFNPLDFPKDQRVTLAIWMAKHHPS